MTEPVPLRGLLVVDKPVGPTSMDVCMVVRRRLINGGAPKRVKVGHGGTLDPLASGVVVLLIGKATKLCDRVMAGEKEYTAEIDLAHTSPTDDREAELVKVAFERVPTREEVLAALERFRGEILQSPPAHSAINVGGERAYRLARAGELANLPPRWVEIHEIELMGYTWPVATLRVRCAKGVYIRSLARDLGAALNVGGVLVGLRRTAVGRFRIEDATHLNDVPNELTQEDLLPVPRELES